MASKKLQKQTEYWVQKGLIEKNQADAILADPNEGGLQVSGNTFVLLAVIGSILAGLGIIFILASNWDNISKGLKLFLAISSMLAFYSGGYFLINKKNMPKTGNALFFVGAVLFGAIIFMLGQAYNFQSNFTSGFIIWFLSIIPLVYLLKSKLIAVLSFSISIGFVISYFESGYAESQQTPYIILAISLLWIFIALWHNEFNVTKLYTNPYLVPALAVWSIPALILSGRFTGYFSPRSMTNIHFIIALVSIIGIGIPIYDWYKKKLNAATLIGPAFLLSTLTIIYVPFLLFILRIYPGIRGGRLPSFFLPVNLMFFIFLLLIIITAHKERKPLLAYSVSVIFGFGIFFRYVELSMSYAQGQLGIILLGAGVLLLFLGGGMEAQRRRFKNA